MESTSLVKALGLLAATAGSAEGRTLAALAAELGLAKPTAHRILKSLTALGYLQRTAAGVYRQTSQVHRLVSGEPLQRLTAVADPVLRELHRRTRETVNLGILRHDQVVYLQVLESTQPLRRVATPQSVDSFHSTALGRSIVAFLPAAQRTLLLRTGRLEKHTPRTNVDRARLAALIERVARDGHAIEVDETDLGVTCIGAPILEAGHAVAAISLSVPTVRTGGAQMPALVAAVRAAAAQVSAKLARRARPGQRVPKIAISQSPAAARRAQPRTDRDTSEVVRAASRAKPNSRHHS